MKNKNNKAEFCFEIDSIRDYLETRIFELQSIRDQYSGAIEAYKDVLNKIQEQELDQPDGGKSETSVDT